MNAKKVIKSEKQRLETRQYLLENYQSLLAYEIEKQSKMEGWEWLEQADEILRIKHELLDLEHKILQSQTTIELMKKEVK